MAETNLDQIQGVATGKYGMERALYEHTRNPDVLIGVENQTRPSIDMRLYYLTGNILYSIFPNNFPKIVESKTDQKGRSFAVVGKVQHPPHKYSEEYRVAKDEFIKDFSAILAPELEPYMEDIIDFDGDQPNLLIDNEGHPVYVDKVTPTILEAIDYDRLKQVVTNPEKLDLIWRVIQKTIQMNQEWREKRKAMDEMMDELEGSLKGAH